jgi:polar amino acid transport system permease protein
MTRYKALRTISLPQAGLRLLGPIGNQLIILVKDTSLVSAIGVAELTMTGKVAIERLAVTLEIFIAIALLYLILTGALGAGLRLVERRVSERLG